MLASLDSQYFILEDFLADPCYRNLDVIVISWIARFIVTTLWISELGRFISYTVVALAVLTFMAVSCMELLSQKPVRSTYMRYIQVKIILATIFPTLSGIVGTLTFAVHFGTIFWLWLGIRCWNLIPVFISVSAIFFGIFLIVYVSIMFLAAGQVRHLAEVLVKKKILNYYSRRANPVNNDYYFYSLWRSQILVGVPCGSFLVIQRSFTMAYLEELSNNLATAVLVIHP